MEILSLHKLILLAIDVNKLLWDNSGDSVKLLRVKLDNVYIPQSQSAYMLASSLMCKRYGYGS